MERLLLDAMLGTLRTYLRMCGYDAAYALDRGVEADDALLALAAAEDRLLLTRDADLAARADRSVLLETRDVRDQLRELRDGGFAFVLDVPERCANCNARLERVDAGASTPEYAPDPSERTVWRCPACGQYFWMGSHWDDVAATLAEL